MFIVSLICDSGIRRQRIRALMLSTSLLVLLGAPFSVQRCIAQQTDDAEDQSLEQQSFQSLDHQTEEMSNQDTGPTPVQAIGPASRQPSGQPLSRPANAQTSPAQNPQTNQQLSQPLNELRVSAEQLISFLETEPDLLQSVKAQIEQRGGQGPGPVTDEKFYERIRQDASIRELITVELIKRGYGQDLMALAENSPSMRPSAPERQPYANPNNPQIQQGLSPYSNMPSLADLYAQFPTGRAKLRRFGSDAFLVGTGNANQLPIDLPAGPDYVLGPGDELTLNLWGGRSVRLSRFIDRQGQVELPEAGSVMVDGMTIAQAETAIQKALDKQFHDEHIEISLGRLRTVRVYVVGDVQRPGAYDVSSLSTPLAALYAAGGPTSRGSLRILRQYRGKQLVREIDLYDFLLRGVRSNDDRLLPGDTILVPTVGPQVSIEGTVRRPAIYELNGEQTLDKVLELSGGPLASADLKQVRVQRIEAHQKRVMLDLQLPADHAEADQKLAAFKVQDGDDVLISQIMPYSDKAVYLIGHVYHPGKYAFKEGMTLSDLLRSYQDVMPEPAEHAELIRLQPPDFRPVAISINLPDVLIGDNPIPLRPFDLVRVYGRYEVDAPSVVINGEVLRPGKYPMSQGMTLSDLVRLAGGFRRSAFTSQGDLLSYNIQDGQNVLVSHTEVDLQRALDGAKDADVSLKPGDVVNIRALAGWQDIGATVVINGEVEHAGSYGIIDGERLSSVLERAGGFRKDAYPYAAIFERVQVRELNEQVRQQMITRIEETPIAVNANATNLDQNAEQIRSSLEVQRQEILASLRNHPANGRLVINVSTDIGKWKNTPADIIMRAGDTVLIPKRPEFVMVSGQLYNPVTISYVPGKNLRWYLRKSGGLTRWGDKKDMYVLRADGSVIPREGGWLGNNFMNIRMRPGDTIVVPEKIEGGSQVWNKISAIAQSLTVAMIPLAVSGVL